MSVEPWLRGTLAEGDAVQRAVLHAFEMAAEDLELWCGPLSDEELNARPFEVAPVAFHRLPSAHEAGIVVGGTLPILHWIGLIGGVVFCVATGWLWLWAEVPARIGFARQIVLTAVMLLVTAYSQFRVLPAMEVDRALAGGEVETASPENPGGVTPTI